MVLDNLLVCDLRALMCECMFRLHRLMIVTVVLVSGGGGG